MKLLRTLLLLMLFALPTLAQEDEPILPDVITFEAPAGLQPEGVVWDEERGHFLVGSLLDGTIGSVDDEGVYTALFNDESFVSTVGLHIADGKLYIANGSVSAFRGSSGHAGLAVYDLEAEELLFSVDLNETFDGTGSRFANDVAVDPDGNAYVTDTMQPVIYKVTPEGEASVFITDPLLDTNSFGLNGIDYHPDGYLLVAVVGSLSLVRIPLDDPQSLTAVAWEPLSAIDGLALSEDGTTLYAVANINGGTPAIATYVSDDDWQTATLVARGPSERAATTLTLRGDAVYYIAAHNQNLARTEYEIKRVVFEAEE